MSGPLFTALFELGLLSGVFNLKHTRELHLIREIWLNGFASPSKLRPAAAPTRTRLSVPMLITTIVRGIQMKSNLGFSQTNLELGNIFLRVDKSLDADNGNSLSAVLQSSVLATNFQGNLSGSSEGYFAVFRFIC